MGRPHSVGRGRLDAQLGGASRCSAPSGSANARVRAGGPGGADRAVIVRVPAVESVPSTPTTRVVLVVRNRHVRTCTGGVVRQVVAVGDLRSVGTGPT